MNSLLQFYETSDPKEFDSLVSRLEYPFTQGFVYGEWHQKSGRSVRRFLVNKEGEIIGLFQVIKYPLPYGVSFLYIPHGPVAKTIDRDGLDLLARKLKEIAVEERAMLIRFDMFPPQQNLVLPGSRPAANLHASFLQPQREWILPLQGQSEEEVLSALHPKTRYDIRLAERKEVEVQVIENDLWNHFDTFYTLLSQTALRDRFRLHPKSYYENIFRLSGQYRNALIVLARYQSATLVANLVILSGKTAYYVFGGSSSEHRNVMAPHLAHWRTIQYLRNHDYAAYNFGGISVEGAPAQDPWSGLTTFKRRFGGYSLSYGTPFEIVTRPGWYYLYRVAKQIREQLAGIVKV